MRVKIFNNTKGKTFDDYCRYVMSKSDLSTILCNRGIITSSPEMMGCSFRFRCNTSPEIKHTDVHMVIQFRKYEDRITDTDKKAEIIREFLARMFWDKCQYIAVIHRDVPGNAHCHLVVNLINDDGRKAKDSYSILKARSLIKKMTYERFGPGMIADPEKQERIHSMVIRSVAESFSMRSLRDNLSMEMIEMDADPEGNIAFNEIGNPVSFTFAGLTAMEIARKMHRIHEESRRITPEIKVTVRHKRTL